MNETSVEYLLKNFPGTRYYPKFELTTWHPQGSFDAVLTVIQVRSFSERKAAADWLEVPETILESCRR
jgi:hypothetical protein